MGRRAVAPPGRPVLWDVALLPLLFFTVVVGLLFAAAMAPEQDDRRTAVAEQRTMAEQRAVEPGARFGVFYWVLAVVLVIAIFAGYYQVYV